MKGLIIGASSGIGKAIATYVKETGVPMCSEWSTPGTDILDVRSSTEVFAMVRKDGPFDCIVYSAGINELAWASTLGAQFDTTMMNVWDINCMGFVRIMGAHEQLYPKSKGSAVAISSDAARRPMRGSIAYCSSKAALDMAVKTLAREMAPRWRINAVSPGITQGTEMTKYLDDTIPRFRGWTPEGAYQYEQSQIPMKRRAVPEEIASFVAQVLEGPEYMTGAILEVNGGR